LIKFSSRISITTSTCGVLGADDHVQAK